MEQNGVRNRDKALDAKINAESWKTETARQSKNLKDRKEEIKREIEGRAKEKGEDNKGGRDRDKNRETPCTFNTNSSDFHLCVITFCPIVWFQSDSLVFYWWTNIEIPAATL